MERQVRRAKNGFPNGFLNGFPEGFPDGFLNGFPNGLQANRIGRMEKLSGHVVCHLTALPLYNMKAVP